ncbi:uncharacterized protein RCC_01784 [Ramularia collo-cygni]|uniref:Ribosomal protein L9 domain-containing protein n=1 Tax=Ramularia collo-cygni TaxID=112498 RepID=A0A2D3UR63_9PEZI|nr:uncharacterized protein RCC_01784 [Ramularia collo-cygni]CZT15945.1 uncharacterized protein RCC_01784 [Ramularia collo-cygni]
MALPLRTRSICLRTSSLPAIPSQSRGAKKMARPSGMTTAKLLKDLPTFGRAGSLVPIPTGQMRNRFFPLRIADYVTQSERRSIKLNNIPVERDYNFGKEEEGAVFDDSTAPFGGMNAYAEEQERVERMSRRNKGVEVEKLTVERSLELLEIFVHPRLDFYRQPLPPVIEDEPVKEAPKERMRTASSAAADLLEARTAVPKAKPNAGPQGIYGSVSAQDVLVAIRAAIHSNDEAAKIQLREEDIVFLDDKVGRAVKSVGDFTVEIGVKGAEKGIKRTVRVIPQEVV